MEDARTGHPSEGNFFLMTVGSDLILQNMREQFHKPSARPINYLAVLEERMNLFMRMRVDGDEEARAAEHQRMRLREELLDHLLSPYGVDAEDVADITSDVRGLLSAAYATFVLNRGRFVQSYFTRSILGRLVPLAKEARSDLSRTDKSVANVRKRVRTLDAALVICRLETILDELHAEPVLDADESPLEALIGDAEDEYEAAATLRALDDHFGIEGLREACRPFLEDEELRAVLAHEVEWALYDAHGVEEGS